jgi:hypothetical protein
MVGLALLSRPSIIPAGIFPLVVQKPHVSDVRAGLFAHDPLAQKIRAANVVHDHDLSSFPWLGSALVLSGLILFFQLFPSVWATVVSFALVVSSYADVRGWTWRSYAVTCVVAIIALVGVKAWQENAANRR